jgi:retron-type reverse transcriptase
VYIPKDKHGQRPLGIATMEDKVMQASVQKVIEPIYEEDFKLDIPQKSGLQVKLQKSSKLP